MTGIDITEIVSRISEERALALDQACIQFLEKNGINARGIRDVATAQHFRKALQERGYRLEIEYTNSGSMDGSEKVEFKLYKIQWVDNAVVEFMSPFKPIDHGTA
jgi:hypothetical protein